MPPRGDDVGSTDVFYPVSPGKVGRRNSAHRISARSILKVFSNHRNSKHHDVPKLSPKVTPDRPSFKRLLSAHSHPLVVDSPTEDLVSAEHSVHDDDAYASAKISLASVSEGSTTKIPFEVTVVEEVHPRGAAYSEMDQKLEQAKMEAQEYRLQLTATQGLLDVMSQDLRKERSRVHDLIFQNKQLLTEVLASAGKDEATKDTQAMMKQEMVLLKICLFFSMVFVMCGGKPFFLAIVVLLWTIVDMFAG